MRTDAKCPTSKFLHGRSVDGDNTNDDNSNVNNNNNNDNDDDDAADGESYSASEDAVERHLSKVMQIHESVNNTLDRYRSKMCQKGSVYRKKRASNTMEAGTSVYITPDHDNNQRTRKRKLQPTFSETGTFKRLTANNRTAVVVIDNKETRVPVMRIKPKRP